MTIDSRLSSALARRGYEPLSRFIAKALGFGCGPHRGGAVCGLGLTDEQVVELLERRADAAQSERIVPRMVPHSLKGDTHEAPCH